MFKKKVLVPHITQRKFVEDFDKILSSTDLLVCHGDMDFITLESLFQKNNVEVPSYDWVEKVNTATTTTNQHND